MYWAPVTLSTPRLGAGNPTDLALCGWLFPGQTGEPSLVLLFLWLLLLEAAWSVLSKELARANFKELASSVVCAGTIAEHGRGRRSRKADL